MNKLILFDIDGTLLAGKHGHPKAFSDAFKIVYGVDAEIDWKGVQGMTDQQIITKTLAEKGVDGDVVWEKMVFCMEEMKESFNKSIDNSEIFALEGIKELLPELKSSGAILGLVTGNLISIAQAKLKKLGLWNFFDVGGFGSDDISRTKLVKLAIKKAQDNYNFIYDNNVILLGDASQDIIAGNEAGVYTIGVATGVYAREDLEKAGAKLIFNSLKDTDKVMEIISNGFIN